MLATILGKSKNGVVRLECTCTMRKCIQRHYKNLSAIFSWVTQEVKNAVGKTPVAAQTGRLGKAGNAARCVFDLLPFGLSRQARAAVWQILAGPPARLRCAPCIASPAGATWPMKKS
ncbi:hypothetical protein D8I35_06665 [Corticibacter populi]|uniref:Uncharacterized protein n=1 Tax=Corticibacter populi TaxID=1550736 RepID=A0A3M6R0E2_9BURK|nr:hypothetical protein D8I35_06665 [Corticibacter populi]RZS36076.1 hypothetical protein EV687_1165 [Corticibacter populi]